MKESHKPAPPANFSRLGETQPVKKTHQTLSFDNGDSIAIPDKKNLAFMGTLVSFATSAVFLVDDTEILWHLSSD